MKTFLLVLALVTMLAIPAMAHEWEVGEGTGSLVIQTLTQVPEFPLPMGQQLAVEWFQPRVGIDMGIKWSRRDINGTLAFCSEKAKEDGFERICMEFVSAGLVARYNYAKKTNALINGQLVFNGTGKFFLIDIDCNGNERPDTLIEGGDAMINGTMGINRNGVATLQGVTVQGGNLGFLFRGGLTGRLQMEIGYNTVD